MSETATPSRRPLRDTTGPALVTGDAVVLDVPPAGIGMRILAAVIDLFVRVVTLVAVLVVLTAFLGDSISDAVKAGITVATMASCFVLGPAMMETLSTGRSVGKRACGLRAVRTDGGAISFRHALVRAFIGYVEVFMTMGVVAFAVAMLTTRNRRLGDLAAGTYVVREVKRLALPPVAWMPPQLAGWANVATVTPLPTAVGAAMTSLVRGASGVSTPVYRAQVESVLRAILPHVSPPPPPGHDPLAVLVAISVLRRDADLRALARDDAVRRRLLTRA